MSNFDQSRQADLRDIEVKLADPNIHARQKRKMRRTKARILEQEKIPEVQQLRRRYIAAVRADDQDAMRDIGEQLKKFDQRLGLDRRKL